MTTEKEKAKRYDEALEWMRKVYPTLTGAAKEDAEHYFPELKESEDETHRKWILEYLYDGLRKSDEQFKGQFKSAIAWLEKQKEQKPVTINQDEKEFLADEITAFLCNYDKEFDGEDPVPSEVAEHFYLLGKQAQEQKPVEWNEEDEDMLNSCISSIEESKENRYAYKENDGDTSYDREIAWLKSLRPVKQEQKPEAKLTCWVARDKEHDSYYGTGLILYSKKPRRSDNCWNGDIVMQLPWGLFPDLIWVDPPMEVEITIRKK